MATQQELLDEIKRLQQEQAAFKAKVLDTGKRAAREQKWCSVATRTMHEFGFNGGLYFLDFTCTFRQAVEAPVPLEDFSSVELLSDQGLKLWVNRSKNITLQRPVGFSQRSALIYTQELTDIRRSGSR